MTVPVLALLLVAFVPVQPPDAVQLVALVDDQVRVDEAPVARLVGFAASVTVGAGTTVTVADWLAVPPVPVQASVYVVVLATAPVLALPVVAFVPVQPPVAVQVVALVDDQVRVDEAPLARLVGFAENVTVGTGGGVTVTVTVWFAEPPGPVQVRV